ncbi:hypothetical protein [Flavobacterium selenitireducens]|uniref:hypothetical protein n=1 Tax=Flavobacterium selenitireducens TaxID=2722704 RepID=UPI00168AF761|nr:hypothetical protein [Flavobacterium selenitireducens]MBD3582303.1 hypothetical protein [Flavobacterium selenitireducens]
MKKLMLIPAMLLLQSCAIHGLTDDYKKLDDAQKSRVADADFQNPQIDKIYKITGAQLLSEIAKHDKVLVYEFTNGCTSDHCKPMIVYERFARANGYKLFLVMNGYGMLGETLAQRNSFESPLYAINSKAYPTVYRAKYSRMFRRELSGAAYDEDNYGGLFFFENGKFVKQLSDLPNS